MSIDYSYEVLLDTPFDDVSLLKIIKRGQDLGFKYLDRKDYRDDSWEKIPEMNTERILKKILDDNEKKYDDDNYVAGLTIVYKEDNQNTSFMLTITNKNDKVRVVLFPLGIWYKKFTMDSYQHIDLGRHMQFLLKLCEDFPVLEAKTTTIDEEEES